jgi:ubiquinone/menaquinone biosynthesis C-methylase UbiE
VGLWARVESASTGARQRQAAAIFLGRPVRWRDRAVSAAYFAVAAGQWGRWATSAGHVAAVEAGLAALSQPPAVAIDVGTGTGAAAAVVAARFPSARVVGVDPSRRMIRRARSEHSGVSFTRGGAGRLPVPDRGADLVVCLNAVPDVVELRRALSPDGAALMATSTRALSTRTEEWHARWRQAGFTRVASGDAEAGSWELFRVFPAFSGHDGG